MNYPLRDLSVEEIPVICPLCSSMVMNKATHLEWHLEVDRGLNR